VNERPMRRGAKPAKDKVQAKAAVTRKSPKNDDARVRDLEKRVAEALGQLQTRDRELTEALEQQTATSEILHVISSSPSDVQPGLDAVAESAARLCDAVTATVFRFDGTLIHLVAHRNSTRHDSMPSAGFTRCSRAGGAVPGE
jgi:hypothetical protein